MKVSDRRGKPMSTYAIARRSPISLVTTARRKRHAGGSAARSAVPGSCRRRAGPTAGLRGPWGVRPAPVGRQPEPLVPDPLPLESEPLSADADPEPLVPVAGPGKAEPEPPIPEPDPLETDPEALKLAP